MRNEKQFKKFISEIAVKIANKDFLLLEEDPKDEEEDMYKDTTKQDRSEKGVMDPMDVVYKGIKHGTPTEKNVMDKSLKNLAQKIEDQSGDSATGIVFGRSNRGQTTTDDGTVSSEGYNATKFVVEFRKRKAFSVSILPNDRIVYDSRSKFVSPDLKKEIDSFLLNYKRKAGIVGSEIRYEGIKLSNSLKKQAADVLSKLSLDIDDTVSLATISTKGAGNKRESITFKVVFDNMPAFLGVVRVDPSNFPKPSSDPDKRERSTSFTPGYTTDKSGNVIKPFSGDPKRMNRYTPVSPGSQGNPKKRFDSLKEVDYAYASKSTRLKEPQIKAGFLTAGGNVIDLSRVDYIEQPTKDALLKFLKDLAFDEIKEETEETENTNNKMRNEKEFKKRISEIAANIANVTEKVDAEKLNLPDTFKAQANSAVGSPSDFAVALLDIINELLAGETSMQDIEKRPGWNLIMDRLKSLAGEKKGKEGEEDVPEVPDADKKEMPQLQEAFNRINRK